MDLLNVIEYLFVVHLSLRNAYNQARLSSCLSVQVTCLSVCVSWTGLSSIQLALGLQEGKLGVTPAYMADTSHSKWAPHKLEHVCPSLHIVACRRGRALRRPHAPVCARPPLLCVRRGFRFDTSASLKLPKTHYKLKKKIGKKFFTRKCPPKEDG